MLPRKLNILTFIFSIIAIICKEDISAYLINVFNDSDCVILITAESSTWKSGFAELVDSGETRSLNFGDSCPWQIKVSNFLAIPGENPLPIELHYGDKVSEQCCDKNLKISANSDDWAKVTKLMVHTDVWAHDGSRKEWKNDWSSPEKKNVSRFKPKL
jgi:hypothetical protein